MAQDPSLLKSMPLYRDVDRIYNELRAAGLDEKEKLSVAELTPHDQYHYHGTAAVDIAIQSLNIGEKSRVLEIGSGIGGPARHMAASTGAPIVALELQPDLNETATDLTRRCGLSNQIEHVCIDVLAYDSDRKPFDAIVSWLAFFHIERRQRLLEKCWCWLDYAGSILVEDLYASGRPTTDEQEVLESLLYSQYLPTLKQYEKDFRAAGFSAVKILEMSADWREFTNDRYKDFCNRRKRHLEIHGKEIFAGLDLFYGAVARLFAAGNLGGLRLICN